MLDHFSGHGSNNFLPHLERVQVLFLFRNTTSKLQSIDAGIIDRVKCRYHGLQYSRALDLLQNSSSNIYKIDYPTAMKYIQAVWNEFTTKDISNWCIFLGLLKTKEVSTVVVLSDVVDEIDELQKMVYRLVRNAHCMFVPFFSTKTTMTTLKIAQMQS